MYCCYIFGIFYICAFAGSLVDEIGRSFPYRCYLLRVHTRSSIAAEWIVKQHIYGNIHSVAITLGYFVN